MKKMVRGDLTVMMSLVFLLMLSLIGALLESASIQTAKNEKRADVTRALESVFAEYHRDLFDEYMIFAMDGSYESAGYSEQNVLDRLSYYGTEYIDMNIEAIRYLTDQNGKAFFEQAVQYEKERTGADKIENLLGDTAVLGTLEEKSNLYEKEIIEMSNLFDQMQMTNEEKLPDTYNPFRFISDLKKEGLLKITLPENFSISNKSILLSEVPSVRMNQKGFGVWDKKTESAADAIFFNLYLLEHYQTAMKSKKEHALQYEIEYLLGGKPSDEENLEQVVNTLCNIRFAIDYMYLLTDSAKQAEARAFAGGVCTLLTVPGITEVVAQGMLFAWAYAEAIQDVKILLTGKKLSIWKNAENWKLSIENCMRVTEESTASYDGDAGGIGYEEYLRILLVMHAKEKLSMRSLDLIETNIRCKEGQQNFRVDHCITGIRTEAACSLRRGVRYEFESSYEYQ